MRLRAGSAALLRVSAFRRSLDSKLLYKVRVYTALHDMSCSHCLHCPDRLLNGPLLHQVELIQPRLVPKASSEKTVINDGEVLHRLLEVLLRPELGLLGVLVELSLPGIYISRLSQRDIDGQRDVCAAVGGRVRRRGLVQVDADHGEKDLDEVGLALGQVELGHDLDALQRRVQVGRAGGRRG